jgi:hypothetical protein
VRLESLLQAGRIIQRPGRFQSVAPGQ